MADLREALEAATAATFCTLSEPIEKTLQLGENWYNNQNFPGFGSGPTPLGQGLRAARNVLCGVPPDDASGQFSTPFTGGQCPGTIYEFDQQRGGSTINTERETDDGDPIKGRIGAVQERVNEFNLLDYVVPVGNGEVTLATNFSTPQNFRIVAVRAVDGPDDCGDPPAQPPEQYNPTDFTDTVDVTYDPPTGPSVTIPVGLVFAPVTVDVDGSVQVPVQVEFAPNVNVDATLDLSTGDLKIVQNIDVTLPTELDDPTILDDPMGVPGDPITGLEDLEYDIIGVYVRTISAVPPFPGTPRPTDNPGVQFFVPRLGSVSFHCEILSSPGLGWTEDIDVKYSSQVVYCPVPWGAKNVVVTPQPGVTFETTVIRGESERNLALRAAGVL